MDHSSTGGDHNHSLPEVIIIPFETLKKYWRLTVWNDKHMKLRVDPPFDSRKHAQVRFGKPPSDSIVVRLGELLDDRIHRVAPKDVVELAGRYPETEAVFWHDYWSIIRDYLPRETTIDIIRPTNSDDLFGGKVHSVTVKIVGSGSPQ